MTVQLWVAVAGGTLLSGFVWAAEPCMDHYRDVIQPNAEAAAEVYPLLNNERGRGCILGATDTTAIEQQYQTLLGSTLEPADRAMARTLLLDALIDQFSDVPTRICDDSSPACVAGRHLDNLERVRRQIEQGEFDPIEQSLDSWFPTEFDGSISMSSVVISDLLEQQCTAGIDTADCAEAVALSAKLMRTSLAMDQLIAAYRLPLIEVNEAFLSGRDREWQTYLNESPVQYPWELAVNGWRYQRTTDDLDKFPRAPENQWILFHPSPGAESVDTPGGGRTTAAAIVVEVIGYQRWRWQAGERRNRWGVSAIVSLVDIDGMDTMGFGAMVHTPIPHASLGVVWRDGDAGSETGILLSVDLAKMIQQYGNGDLFSFLGL